jgi:hypothetical protein
VTQWDDLEARRRDAQMKGDVARLAGELRKKKERRRRRRLLRLLKREGKSR